MPTDLYGATHRKSAAQAREERESRNVIFLISSMGSVFTILKAIQSEEFMAALLAFGTLN
jgi:hypothetical protein